MRGESENSKQDSFESAESGFTLLRFAALLRRHLGDIFLLLGRRKDGFKDSACDVLYRADCFVII
jgi:hypothetical protein